MKEAIPPDWTCWTIPRPLALRRLFVSMHLGPDSLTVREYGLGLETPRVSVVPIRSISSARLAASDHGLESVLLLTLDDGSELTLPVQGAFFWCEHINRERARLQARAEAPRDRETRLLRQVRHPRSGRSHRDPADS